MIDPGTENETSKNTQFNSKKCFLSTTGLK